MNLVQDRKDDHSHDAGSDGESSVDEFELDDATSGEEDVVKEAPLVLPDGWRIDRTGGRRLFVDPSGTVYRTEGQAKQAVDAQRRAANVASRLRSKFEAKLNGGVTSAAVASTSQMNGVAAERAAATERAAALARSLRESMLQQKQPDVNSPNGMWGLLHREIRLLAFLCH